MSRPLLLFIPPLFCAIALAQRPEFIEIPPGSITMGCAPEQRCAEALSVQRIEFDRPIWMSKTEVTVSQFRAFVKATGFRTEAEKAGDAWNWKAPGFRLSGRQPVVYVTIDDASAYCRWIGARVPSEAEWEYAVRAGAATPHFWGEGLDDGHVWYRENSGGRLRPAGSKPPNPWGLHDLEGSVWEWVWGDPQDKSSGEPSRVMRGGSYMSCPETSPWQPAGSRRLMRVVARRLTDKRDDDVGFRCAKSAP